MHGLKIHFDLSSVIGILADTVNSFDTEVQLSLNKIDKASMQS